ncbi:unnamed protein product [Linum trigynum]
MLLVSAAVHDVASAIRPEGDGILKQDGTVAAGWVSSTEPTRFGRGLWSDELYKRNHREGDGSIKQEGTVAAGPIKPDGDGIIKQDAIAESGDGIRSKMALGLFLVLQQPLTTTRLSKGTQYSLEEVTDDQSVKVLDEFPVSSKAEKLHNC